MGNNISKSAFYLENYFFDKLTMDLSRLLTNDLSIAFDLNGFFHSEDSSFELVFLTKISCDKGASSFIELRCKAIYKFIKSINKESIPDYFYSNSIAILFPYVRAYISMATTQSNIPGIILPTLNLSSLGVELKEKTK